MNKHNWIKKLIVIEGLILFILGYFAGRAKSEKTIREAFDLSEKNKYLYRTAVQWLSNELSGRGVDYFIDQNRYKKIAVYGLSYLVKNLVYALRKCNVVVYGIDCGVIQNTLDLPVYTLEDKLPEVDAIIVTPIYYYESIKNDLSKVVTCPVFSLADIVFGR